MNLFDKRPTTILASFLVLLLLSGCAKPLAIEIEQTPAQIAISSSVIDAHTLFVTATYSINSLTNLNDGGTAQTPLNLVSNALVTDATIWTSSDTGIDTLRPFYDGLYGSYTLNLIPYKHYDLTVRDNSTGTTVMSATTYLPKIAVDTLRPSVMLTNADTIVHLHLAMDDDPARTDYYVLSYSHISPTSIPSALGGVNFSAILASPAKNLELFTDADAINNRIKLDFTLNANPSDTLYVHTGRIEKGYFEYLTAYKRTGSVITQLTNEPITLPTNILTGLGYFSLYEGSRSVFFLKEYIGR
ncbi:hypothetical protein BH09BAC4_BH09BAC4_17200 [soil metagenome]